MSRENETQTEVVETAPAEFSIMELEDRLEFVEICDNNCDCKTDTAPKPA